METRIISRSSSCDSKGLLEYARKSTPPPFLMKTYMLIEDPATDNVVSWNEDGTGFIVRQTAEFARDLLPKLFKHSNFSSFVRQLNTYGFRKVATSRWEFCNEMFRRGERDLLCNIQRRKAWANKPQPGAPPTQALTLESDEDRRSSSSTLSLSEYNALVDENKRLKKENGDLSSQLSNTKNKCKELLDLVAKYDANNNMEEDFIRNNEEEGEDVDDDGEIQRRPPLKLFGVRLEVAGEIMEKKKKRKRAEIICQSASILLSQSCV